jgi:Transcription factor WhiB
MPGVLDPDQWFPVSADPGRARQEAAAAIAICATCPVRGQCLTLSLHRWDIGQHGVWGGLVAADRARLRRRPRPHHGWTQEPAMAPLDASPRAVPDGPLSGQEMTMINEPVAAAIGIRLPGPAAGTGYGG